MLVEAEASLAASRDELCLVGETTDEASAWLYCAVGGAAAEAPPGEVSGEARAATLSGEVASVKVSVRVRVRVRVRIRVRVRKVRVRTNPDPNPDQP